LPLRWVLETTPNLSKARNIGAKEAKGEYLAYCDDDIEYVDGWLTNLVSRINEYWPDICGGPSFSLYRTPKPYWYLEEWAPGYYLGDKPTETDATIRGMNFIVRKDLVFSIGGFKENLGMVGNKLAYGEETEFMYRAKEYKELLKIMYFPDVAVRHEVRSVKLTLSWFIRSTWALNRDAASVAISHSKNIGRIIGALAIMLKESSIIIFKLPLIIIVFLTDIFHPKTSLWKRYFKVKLLPSIGRISYRYYLLKYKLSTLVDKKAIKR